MSVADQTEERSERRVIAYWWVAGVAWLMFVGSSMVAPLLWAIALSFPVYAPWVWGGGAGLAALALLVILLGAPVRYRILAFRVDADRLWVRSGLFVHREKVVPTSRLQHVDVVRGPIERLFGLASLVLFTAGGAAATYRLPGLTPARAEALRARMLEAAEARRAGDGT